MSSPNPHLASHVSGVISPENNIESHTIAVLVDNEFGVLSRVIGLFSSRGYNIESLSVSEVDKKNNLSRITIITRATQRTIDQIVALLDRLVPVYQVRDLTMESPHIEREIVLVKVFAEDENRVNALKLADRFGARVVDSTEKSFIFELSDTPTTIDTFIEQLHSYDIAEISRTGVTAMARGLHCIKTS